MNNVVRSHSVEEEAKRNPLVIKHGNGKSLIDEGFNGKIIELNGRIFQLATFDDTSGYTSGYIRKPRGP